MVSWLGFCLKEAGVQECRPGSELPIPGVFCMGFSTSLDFCYLLVSLILLMNKMMTKMKMMVIIIITAATYPGLFKGQALD